METPLEALFEILGDLVQSKPGYPAVIDKSGTTTFGEFVGLTVEIKDLVSSQLSRDSHQPRIGLFLEQGATAYAAMLACLALGVSYVPLSIDSPFSKLRETLQEADVDLVILSAETEPLWRDGASERFDVKAVVAPLNAVAGIVELECSERFGSNAPAYVLFTSGSTGRPKGVSISRTALAHYVSWILSQYKTYRNLRVAQLSRIGFDLSVAEIYFSIFGGHTLIAPRSRASTALPLAFIQENRIDCLIAVPSIVDLMVRERGVSSASRPLPNLKFVMFCGEPLYWNQVESLREIWPGVEIFNTYGPTEATVSCSIYAVDQGGPPERDFNNWVPLGTPIDGMSFEILEADERGVGELVISGPQVADGYVNRSSSSFSVNPKDGTRSYRTGDLVFRKGQHYYYVARTDRQIKVKGVRIEIGEIERVLRHLVGLPSAVIVLDGQLVAVSESDRFEDKESIISLRTALRGELVSEAIPKLFIHSDTLPLNQNGKVDYSTLRSQVERMLGDKHLRPT